MYNYYYSSTTVSFLITDCQLCLFLLFNFTNTEKKVLSVVIHATIIRPDRYQCYRLSMQG